MQTLKQLLDFRELTASYMAAPTVGDFMFTNDFYVNVKDAITDEVEMIYFPAANVPAPLNVRGGAARVLTPNGGTKRYASVFVAFNEIGLPADSLVGLRNPEVYELQEKGRQSVEIILEHFRQRHALMKEATFASIMTTGTVNLDEGGNVLVPTVDSLTGAVTNASGTVVAADFAWANNQRGNLNDSTDSGAIIDSFWSNSATRISRHLDRIAYRSGRKNRTKPTEVYVHSLNKKHLRDNTEFKSWAQYHQRSIDEVLRGGIINDLWGFNWHFVDGTYTDVNGTVRDLVPQTVAIITPKPAGWLRAFRGANNVPRNLNVTGTPEQVLDSFETVYGQAAWAKLTDNPVSLEIFMADAFGLNFADPGTVYAPTVFDAQGASGTG